MTAITIHCRPDLVGSHCAISDDYSERLPSDWHRRGGVIAPMYQAEAMWINFRSNQNYPFAIKVGTGKRCAITGDPWFNQLNSDPQDYVLIPNGTYT